MNLQPEDMEVIDVEDPAASSSTDLEGKGEPTAALPREAIPSLGLAGGKSSVAPNLQDDEEKKEPVHNERNNERTTLTEPERRKRQMCFLFIILAFLMVLAAVIAAVYFTKEPWEDRGRLTSWDDGATWAPEPQCPFDFPKEEALNATSFQQSADFPETDLEQSLYDFVLALSSNESLTNTTSPQFKAYRSLVGMYQNEEEVPEWDVYDLTQRYVLNVFFHSSEGSTPQDEDNSSNLYLECFVNSDNEIRYLDLSSLPAMRIPTEIAHLSTLQFLSLYRSVKGTIPSELGQLTALTDLRLSNNAFTGTIPSELGQLTEMRHQLHLEYNLLTGPIPSELGQLTALYWMFLHGNSLTGPIPSEFGQLAELNKLHLHDNALTGTVPNELTQLTNLYTIRLQSNDLTGSVPSAFCAAPFRFGRNYGSLSADCISEVQCDCCNHCYDESGNCFRWSSSERDFLSC